MRTALLTAGATLALLTACRGEDASQANNAQANIGNEASPASTATATAATPLGAPISGDAAKKLMHDRHEGMEEIGDETKKLSNALKSASPDIGAIRSSASRINDLAQQASSWFPPGTGPDVGKTRAKPQIWQKQDDFHAKMREFQQAAAAFNSAAAAGDMNAIRARFAEMGKACKACHDPYRAPEGDH